MILTHSFKKNLYSKLKCMKTVFSTDSDCKFLKKFIREANKLQKSGIYMNGKRKRLEIRCVCVDAPARALICGTKYPTAANGCPFCHQVGRRIGMTMSNKNVSSIPRLKRCISYAYTQARYSFYEWFWRFVHSGY